MKLKTISVMCLSIFLFGCQSRVQYSVDSDIKSDHDLKTYYLYSLKNKNLVPDYAKTKEQIEYSLNKKGYESVSNPTLADFVVSFDSSINSKNIDYAKIDAPLAGKLGRKVESFKEADEQYSIPEKKRLKLPCLSYLKLKASTLSSDNELTPIWSVSTTTATCKLTDYQVVDTLSAVASNFTRKDTTGTIATSIPLKYIKK